VSPCRRSSSADRCRAGGLARGAAGDALAGFELAWAATAAGGLALASRWRPDVVILELSLQDSDDLEVCHRLRTWCAAPIIVLSARDSGVDKLLAFEEGADDYVTKPFGMAEL
jgi:two-component system KDP operon response regulator KdpE